MYTAYYGGTDSVSTFAQACRKRNAPLRQKQVSEQKTKAYARFTPRSYQADAIRWLTDRVFAGLFLAPGLGKTAVVLAAYQHLRQCGAVERLFVVAPRRVCYLVWPKEVDKWGFKFSVGVLHGAQKAQVLKKKHDIYIINPEGLKWLAQQRAEKALFAPKTWLVVDESSLFRNGRSERFKTLRKWLKLFMRRTILTGSPAPNGLEGLWGQVYLLDQGARLGQYITAYRNTYFYPSGYGGYTYLPQDGAEEKIYAAVDDIIMHKGREELDLPPLVPVDIEVQLPKEARCVYGEMEREFMAEIDRVGIVAAVTGAVRNGKLRQITSGFLYGEEKKIISVHEEKLKALQDLVEELEGRPLMVFYEFVAERELLARTFKGMRFMGVGEREDAVTEREWNAGELQLLAMNPKSAGHGLNLQSGGCADLCWYTTTWDLELYEQGYSRVWRQGVGADSVTMHHIVARDTMDQPVAAALQRKEKIQDALKRALTK